MILGMDAWVFWLILTAIFAVVEVLTVNLVSIWFCGGTLAAMIASFCGVSVLLQVLIAVGVSGILLAVVVIFRPFDHFKNNTIEPTNSDRMIGKIGIVEDTIDTIDGKGIVKVCGQVWSAVSKDGSVIEKGAKVTVIEITGVKLIVTPINE